MTTVKKCKFPGCVNLIERGARKGGRAPEYCGQWVDGKVHNPQNWAALNRRSDETDAAVLQLAGIDAPDLATAQRQAPVDLARAQAAVLISELRATATDQADRLAQALERLEELADPRVATAQHAALKASSSAAVAQAEAAQARAEQLAADAQGLADAATADAAAARAEAETARQAAVEALEQLAVAEAAQKTAERQVEDLRRQLSEQVKEPGTQTIRAEEAEDRIDQLEQDLAAEKRDHAGTIAAYDQLQAQATTAAAVAVARAEAATAQITDLQARLAAAEQATTEQARLTEAARAEGMRALHELTQARAEARSEHNDRVRAENTVVDLRAELDQAHATAAAAAEHAAADLAQLRAALTAVQTEAATAAGRASAQAETSAVLRADLEAAREQIAQLRVEASARAPKSK